VAALALGRRDELVEHLGGTAASANGRRLVWRRGIAWLSSRTVSEMGTGGPKLTRAMWSGSSGSGMIRVSGARPRARIATRRFSSAAPDADDDLAAARVDHVEPAGLVGEDVHAVGRGRNRHGWVLWIDGRGDGGRRQSRRTGPRRPSSCRASRRSYS
jgi:hypothetical protein